MIDKSESELSAYILTLFMHMKIIFLTAGLWIIMPVAVFAQGADQATIAQLQAQIQALQNQIRQVQQQSIVPPLPQKSIPVSIQKSPEETTQNIPNFTRDLFFGMKNNPEVSDLQEFLTDQGYYAGPISGNFGLLTLSSVKRFQSAQGIKSTGYFGPRSRAIANEIVQKLVGQICPREEGCEGNILPVERISVTAESDLEGAVGEYISMRFRVSGGSGDYSFQIVDGDVPGMGIALSSACASGKGCGPNIIFSGTPIKSGVFSVTFLVKDNQPSLDVIGLQYGKERFTVVIKDKIVSDKPPVISGVKGPTALRVGEEGIWTVNASDPHNGNLSYRVVWGDEFYAKESVSAAAPSISPFIQTATFSHIYGASGVYTPIFSVVNERGLGAKTSISVNVGSVIEILPPIPVPTGHLTIDPSFAVLKVGDRVRIKAIFTPSRPACLDAIPSCKVSEQAPYEVEAAFASDNAKIAVIETSVSNCASPPPGTPATCPLATNSVHGVSAGDAIIMASYTEEGRTHAAKMKVSVTMNYDACRLDKLDGNNITKRPIENQTQCLAEMCDVYGPANLANGVESKCIFRDQEIKRYIKEGAIMQPSVRVISPNGGEQYQKGSPITFGWSQNYTAKSLEVYLFDSVTGVEYYKASISGSSGKNAGVITGEEIINSVFASKTIGAPSGKYKIRICDLIRPDNYIGQESVCDVSDAPFSIVASSTPVSATPSNMGFASALAAVQEQLDALAAKVKELR